MTTKDSYMEATLIKVVTATRLPQEDIEEEARTTTSTKPNTTLKGMVGMEDSPTTWDILITSVNEEGMVSSQWTRTCKTLPTNRILITEKETRINQTAVATLATISISKVETNLVAFREAAEPLIAQTPHSKDGVVVASREVRIFAICNILPRFWNVTASRSFKPLYRYTVIVML
mmetsp:Transcript_3867/g.7410  ORF Transcript_3867/g.7410 Transcript_3867/m.7410 type:complete len:175 (-) Transcript_3867:69-593(-)